MHMCTPRRLLVLLSMIPVLLLVGVLLSGIPPRYKDVRSYERHLPQHNTTEARAERRKYIRFPDHLWGHGLNNILQESLLMSYIAYASGRAYVFEDYTWSHLPLPYTIYDFALRPTRIPLNSFISGPTAGGPMDNSHVPRAISSEFWNEVCPPEKRRIIHARDSPYEADGPVLVEWWKDHLAGLEDECIEVDEKERRVVDKYFFGGPRLTALFPSLSISPILASFTWSPLVLSALARNFALLRPTNPSSLFASSTPQAPPPILSGLVAIHLRRGDYKRHCPRLAAWGSTYMGFNSFPSLPDKFDPMQFNVTWQPASPAPGADLQFADNNDPEALKKVEAYYLEHCLPDIDQVVVRLRKVREDNPDLRRVYVLTNAWSWWLGSLAKALKKDGWEELVTTLDMELDSEQSWVSMAVDMAIAERAEVFVGNGFSSLTANIVMLRMAKGLTAASNRFL
ncbi:hypothetical protein BDQ12DRAFT_700367 [Crucibulum laeve]|uniref:GDP-fucose protein O-fucosyltransferase-domain-containing protein n=1 Tax=Crucibulum laeve TaxID=68775 RepID=A0A5C3LRA3_9AGAR|nr:hypothetical protein BDQ12DRAFT_700367 [Crucibulum laeve]